MAARIGEHTEWCLRCIAEAVRPLWPWEPGMELQMSVGDSISEVQARVPLERAVCCGKAEQYLKWFLKSFRMVI